MCVAAGKPVALSSDAHEPEHIGYGYDRAVELPARRRASSGSASSSGRERARGAARMSDAAALGIGYDSHRFGGGRPLVLGGVEIPGEPGLQGHSDADVRGARGDRRGARGGRRWATSASHFPDDDPRYAGADSIELLREAVGAMLAEPGWRVVNVDVTVIAEQPRLGAVQARRWRSGWRGRWASTPARVNVKATTNEGMGFIGRGEGIAALRGGARSSGGR